MNHDQLTTGAESSLPRLDRLLASPILWGISLTLGLAALCRQYFFAHSYWYDEAFLILTIRERSYAALVGAQPYNLVIPPVFLWATRALYELGGDGERILRLPAFAAAAAAILLMIPLTRKLVAQPYALWAFAWLAVSRNLVAHGCEVRPYAFDLLLTEAILLCTAVLLSPGDTRFTTACARAGLGALAVFGPWLSFPTAFVLGGASLALGVQLARQGTRRQWLLWLTFNGLIGLSALGLWWLSGRHMYYQGMTEHWGHKGWGGFPDWQSPANLARWLAWRPCEVGNYGSRELGIILAALALVGAGVVAKRSRSQCVLLLGPFGLAVAAALLGKYPLAHRTSFFLAPCLWILAASGWGAAVAWGRRQGRDLAVIGLLLVAWDLSWLLIRLVHPDAGLDYRGAYAFVHSHRHAEEAVWSQMAVVHEVYYGKEDPILKDADFSEVERLVSRQRLWAVLGSNRHDLRQRLEGAGGQVVLAQDFSGVSVLLFNPKKLLAKGANDQ